MSIDLNAPEVQEAIKAAVEEQVSGLKAKNAELLGEVKKLRKNSEIDPAEFQSLKEELETANGKVQELTKQAKQLQGDAERFKQVAEAESGYTAKLLIENGLNDALMKAGVKPEFLKAAKAMIGAGVQLKQDGDSRLPVVGDKNLSDFVAEWSKSDEGKHFVAAPANTGGGATGGHGGAPSVKPGALVGNNQAEKLAAIEALRPQ